MKNEHNYMDSKQQEHNDIADKGQFFTQKDIEERISSLPKGPVKESELKNTYAKVTGDLAAEKTPRELTDGEEAVGLTFNPGGKEEVNKIKTLCTAVIDELKKQQKTVTGEAAAQYQLAIRDIQYGQMMGVKAATWQY